MSRQVYLSERFNEWLDRYAPPRFIADKPQAMQDEADVLLRIVARHAPTEGYAEWLDGVLRALTEGMQARTWPTGGEVSKACMKANTFSGKASRAAPEWILDPMEVSASRINAGEAVGDGWLYGRRCVELLRSGRVTQEQVNRCRSALFFSFKDVYGEAEALRMEGILKAKHAAADDRPEAAREARSLSYGVRRMPGAAE